MCDVRRALGEARLGPAAALIVATQLLIRAVFAALNVLS